MLNVGLNFWPSAKRRSIWFRLCLFVCLSVCMYVRIYVCQTITFENLHLGSLHIYQSYGRLKFNIVWIMIINFFCSCDPLWPDDLHIRIWPVFLEIHPLCKYELPTSRFSRVIFWQRYRTHRQIDTTEIIYNTTSQVVSNFAVVNCTVNSQCIIMTA